MRAACLTALLISLWSASARADDAAGGHGPFGVGLIVGEPTGLTAEFGISDHTAVDAALGVDLFDNRDFYLHVEFLYFLPTLISGSSVSLSAYLGVGGFLITHRPVGVGVRAPFGLSVEFTAAPLEIFAEIALRLLLTPDVAADPGGALGFRYYF